MGISLEIIYTTVRVFCGGQRYSWMSCIQYDVGDWVIALGPYDFTHTWVVHHFMES